MRGWNLIIFPDFKGKYVGSRCLAQFQEVIFSTAKQSVFSTLMAAAVADDINSPPCIRLINSRRCDAESGYYQKEI